MNSEIQDNNKQEDNNLSEIKPKKNNKKLILILIVGIILVTVGILLFTFIGNDKKSSKGVTTGKSKYFSEYKMTGNSLQDFDLYFLKQENQDKNKVYSPLSIKYALNMLQEGADNDSKEQIVSVIGDYKSKKYTNSANMSLANALFIKDTYKNNVKSDYKAKLKDNYNAELIYDTFNTPTNLNNWVGKKTFNLINDLFDNSVSNYDFVLANALAIDMEWNKKLQEYYYVQYKHEKIADERIPLYNSEDECLRNFNNTGINVNASQVGASINNYDIVKTLGEANIRKTITDEYTKWSDENGYEEKDVSKYVDNFIKELDENYGQVKSSTDFSLYVDETVKVFAKDLKKYNGTTLQYIGIMPKNVKLNEYIKNTNASTISELIGKLKTIELNNFTEGKLTKIIGRIPLFKFEYKLDLMNDLKSIGITDIFDKTKANLSGITSDKGSYIDSALHKSNIEFSNEGIKAAAANTLWGDGSAFGGFEYLYEVPVEIIDITFDSPYMFLIRDKSTGEVWFTGTVYEPISNQFNSCKVFKEN